MNRTIFISAFSASIALAPLHAQAPKPGIYYVTQDVLDERLAPSADAAVTNRIHRGQRVDVFESKSGWARVSKYYDGVVEGQGGQVARWVLASGLSTDKPQPLKQPSITRDPRIAEDAFPKVGEGGLTERDVRILHKGALKFLISGAVTRVVFGDKSTNKPNTYYINGGGPKNLFFTASDVNE